MKRTPPDLVDTHAHLADPRFADDMAGVLSRAAAAGVGRILAIGTTVEDSRRVVALAQQYHNFFAAFGIHPNEAAAAGSGDWSEIVELATSPRVVAIGETGLDRHWHATPFDIQQDFFDRHLNLSHRLDLPIIIHSRESQQDILEQLRGQGRPIRGVQHSFTGTNEEAVQLMELGLHLSFAGMITFENKSLNPLRDVASRLPSDRILVETDSPYLSPQPFRGKPNEPARVVLTASFLAELQGESLATFAAHTTRNAEVLFSLA